jgi:tetratricopeptide (TPR) repeat protein
VSGRALGRARELHAGGVAATAAGRPAVGAGRLRSGLRLLGWPGGPVAHPAQAGRLLISLAHAEGEQGRTDLGLSLLDEAETLVAPADRGVLLQQRGLMLQRTGNNTAALALLDAAVPLLTGAEHAVVLARTLLNRAVQHLGAGRVGLAREDLRASRRIAVERGLDALAAKTGHNLGYCELLAGDIPAALRAFEEAAVGYREHAPGIMPILAVDRARALLAAGLAGEAGRELDTAIEAFRGQRLTQDLGEAELARAQVALMARDFTAASRWTVRARRRFRRRGNESWVALSELVGLRAGVLAGAGPAGAAGLEREAEELAGRLRKLGLTDDAAVADWLWVRTLVAGHKVAEAERLAAELPRVRPGAPLETRLLYRLAAAELAGAQGFRGRAFRHLRDGLSALHEHRSRLGSADLQAGTAALGVELAGTGLLAALVEGSPRLVYAWSERTRAQAFRIRPVRPPADPEVAEAVAELRALRGQLRAAELAGQRDPAAQRRCAELERRITERGWQVRGPGQASAAAGFDAVAGALAESGQTLVSLMSRHGQLVGLVIADGTARMVGLGRYADAAEAQRRLLGDLDALAGRRLPDRMAAVVHGSVRRQLDALSTELLAPLARHLGPGDLVLVPTMALSALPWGLLPALRGRPVTVAPSASTWLAARTARRGSRAAAPPLLVAGPGLSHAEPEVAGLAGVYPGARRLAGEAATVSAALAAMDGAPVAHFATHGHHDRENVLFSRLDLADGPLMAYDLQQLAVPPEQVILSACDVGRAVVRPGDELLGFTAALLYAGTAGVISSVTRVPDEDAVRVMTAFHRELATGAGPAAALARAAESEPLSSFVCFGSG